MSTTYLSRAILDQLDASAVLNKSFTCPPKTDNPDGGVVRLGLHMIDLVPPVGFEPTLSEV